MRPHLRRIVAGLLALPVAIGVAVLPSGSATATPDRGAAAQRQATVMSRNLFLGADLTPLVLATTPAQVQAAVGAILGQVVASDPPRRMGWVADEIAADRPDVVGLQEAALWQIHLPNGATITYDFVQLLVDALAARGAHYRVAVAQENFDSAKQLANAPLPARFVDRDAILVAEQTGSDRQRVLDTGAAHYASQLTFPTLLGPVDFERGYVWTDLKSRGRTWRFVDTHFEAYAGFGATPRDYTSEQAAELAGALPAGTPTVVVGDLNSSATDPVRQGYSVLTGAGLADAWLALHPGDPGFTCCRGDSLAGGTLYERIDDVLYTGAVEPLEMHRVGIEPDAATAPRWPSDHAGVVATVAIGKD